MCCATMNRKNFNLKLKPLQKIIEENKFDSSFIIIFCDFMRSNTNLVHANCGFEFCRQ